MATISLISVLFEDENDHFYVTQITKTDLILFAIDTDSLFLEDR